MIAAVCGLFNAGAAFSENWCMVKRGLTGHCAGGLV